MQSYELHPLMYSMLNAMCATSVLALSAWIFALWLGRKISTKAWI